MSKFERWDSRADFLDWVRDRAEKFLEKGMLYEAFSSVTWDIQSHPQVNDLDEQIMLGRLLIISGKMNDTKKMREFLRTFR